MFTGSKHYSKSQKKVWKSAKNVFLVYPRSILNPIRFKSEFKYHCHLIINKCQVLTTLCEFGESCKNVCSWKKVLIIQRFSAMCFLVVFGQPRKHSLKFDSRRWMVKFFDPEIRKIVDPWKLKKDNFQTA